MFDIYRAIPVQEFDSKEGILRVLTLAPELFEAKRLYWISNVPKGEKRGMHAHRNLKQIFICLAGSLKVTFDDGFVVKTFQMSSDSPAIEIRSGLWRELFDFSSDAVLLVICDEEFIESDYIRNYEDFVNWKRAK